MTFKHNARGVLNSYVMAKSTLAGALAIGLFTFGMLVVVAPSMASNAMTTQFVVVAVQTVIKPVKPGRISVALSQEQDKEESGKEALAEYLAKKYSQSKAAVDRIVRASYIEGTKFGVSPLLVLAIIEKESSLRASIRNDYDAQGLMQIVPKWHPEKVTAISHPDGLLHPETNIRVGTEILSEYLGKYSGDVNKALRRYSGSAEGYVTRVQLYQAQLQGVLDDQASSPEGAFRPATET